MVVIDLGLIGLITTLPSDILRVGWVSKAEIPKAAIYAVFLPCRVSRMTSMTAGLLGIDHNHKRSATRNRVRKTREMEGQRCREIETQRYRGTQGYVDLKSIHRLFV